MPQEFLKVQVCKSRDPSTMTTKVAVSLPIDHCYQKIGGIKPLPFAQNYKETFSAVS